MCGRSSLTKTQKEIEIRFKANFYSEELERYNPLPNFNIAPTHYVPVILSDNAAAIRLLRWGLIPFWAANKSIGSKMINARAETLMDKPAFKNLLQSQRCLVPMDGFYEWRREGNKKLPYRIISSHQEIFSVCGLWDKWNDKTTGENIHSYTIITVAANEKMSYLHNRMPVLLNPEIEKLWLDESLGVKDLLQLLKPCKNHEIEYYRVSEQVNNVKENNPDLIKPFNEKTSGIQGTLF